MRKVLSVTLTRRRDQIPEFLAVSFTARRPAKPDAQVSSGRAYWAMGEASGRTRCLRLSLMDRGRRSLLQTFLAVAFTRRRAAQPDANISRCYF